MRRLAFPIALLVLFALPVAKADPAPSPAPAAPSEKPPVTAPRPPPPPQNLELLRAESAKAQWDAALSLCDQMIERYSQQRDGAAPQSVAWLGSSRTVGYCLFLKAQVLALKDDFPAAETALTAAESYRSAHPELQSPKLVSFWQEVALTTQGLILEKEGKLDAAVQVYVQMADSPKASGRLAVLEFDRGHTDQAKTWALIHADDPTSQFVLGELAVKAKNIPAARQHADRAFGQLAKAVATGQEFMPLYFCEMPHIAALRASLKTPPAGAK